MRTLTQAQADFVDAVVAEKDVGGLTAAIFEKDIHVTDVLQALFAIQHAHVRLAFCGGTSLSKCHGVIERMSEDIDIKVILAEDHGMSKNAVRKHLKGLKARVEATHERRRIRARRFKFQRPQRIQVLHRRLGV
jgi:predicted nucleotidyltransferase component of viral defense system